MLEASKRTWSLILSCCFIVKGATETHGKERYLWQLGEGDSFFPRTQHEAWPVSWPLQLFSHHKTSSLIQPSPTRIPRSSPASSSRQDSASGFSGYSLFVWEPYQNFSDSERPNLILAGHQDTKTSSWVIYSFLDVINIYQKFLICQALWNKCE